MSTATQTFQTKGVFHSALVKACGRDGLAVMFTGPVRDSKYAGKPAYIPFKVQGEDGEHTYNIENDLCREVLEGAPQNVWLVVRAEGTREGATIAVEDANGNYVNKAVPRNEIAQPKPQNAPPPNEWAEEAVEVTLGGTTSATVTVAVAMTIAAVQGLEKAGIRVDSDAAARIYNTHYIQASRG